MQKKFSYPLTVADLPQAEQHYRLRAEEADCRYLAEVLQLPAVNRLEADLRLKNNHAEGMLDVSGHVFAGIKLESVISLELFDQNYDFDFSLDGRSAGRGRRRKNRPGRHRNRTDSAAPGRLSAPAGRSICLRVRI